MQEQRTRPIVSRRDRPAKAPLSRDVIVETGLALLTREGLEGLTLRKIATALDTGPASLYVYVANLEELQALVLDRAFADMVWPTDAGASWEQKVKALLTASFRTLYACPGLARLALSMIPAGHNSMLLTEELLGLLLEGGLSEASAAWAVDLLSLYITAIAAEQDFRRGRGDVLEPVIEAFKQADPERFPHIHALRPHLMSGDQSRFDWALDVLLAGLKAGAPPSGHVESP
jgi:AcrR family transcriptional regulator